MYGNNCTLTGVFKCKGAEILVKHKLKGTKDKVWKVETSSWIAVGLLFVGFYGQLLLIQLAVQ